MAAHPKNKTRKVLLWLAFSVIFALGPIFINYVIARDKQDFYWLQLLNGGELFLISAAICADAVGRTLGQKGQAGNFSTLCLVACVFILFMSSAEFGIAAESFDAGKRLTHSQAIDSLIMFGVTVMAGLGVILVED